MNEWTFFLLFVVSFLVFLLLRSLRGWLFQENPPDTVVAVLLVIGLWFSVCIGFLSISELVYLVSSSPGPAMILLLPYPLGMGIAVIVFSKELALIWLDLRDRARQSRDEDNADATAE